MEEAVETIPAWSDDYPHVPTRNLPELRHERIAQTACTCTAVPEQHEGVLMDGRIFYFRLRFSRVTLGVGATFDDAVMDGWKRRAASYEPYPADPGWTGSFGDDDQSRQRIFADLLEDIA